MRSRRQGHRPAFWGVVLSASLLALPLGGRAFAEAGDRSSIADLDFATAMITHHQAEIELAQAVMQRGTDPDLRKLAQVVNATHRRQLAFLKSWLAGGPTKDPQAYSFDRHDP